MCDVYLHRLDREWDDRDGALCRYAGDLVVMCWSRSQAEAALERLTALLAGLGLEPKAAKTRIVHLDEGAGYFRYGHPARRLSEIRSCARMRLVLFISKRHRRSRNFGWHVMISASPRELGLVSCTESPSRPGPESPGGKALAGEAECRR